MIDDQDYADLAGSDARKLVLDRLNALYEEAITAWARSKEPVIRTRVIRDPETGEAYERVETTEQRASGDPRLLGQAQQVLAAIRSVLGLDAPTLAASAQVVTLARSPESDPGPMDVEHLPVLEIGGYTPAFEGDDSES